MKKVFFVSSLIFSSVFCFSQSTLNMYYEYSNPKYDPQFVSVADSNAVTFAQGNASNQFGFGLNTIIFGSGAQSFHFAMGAEYRQLRLGSPVFNSLVNKKVSTVEYMLGGDFCPNKALFHVGKLWAWINASALAGMGWSYQFDAVVTAGFHFYPVKEDVSNASGMSIEFVYHPMLVEKSKSGMMEKLDKIYTINPSWGIRMGFVFDSGTKISRTTN